MFILNTNEVGITMFVKGQKVESEMDLWHKRIDHINSPQLQEIQTKQIVFSDLVAGRANSMNPANSGSNINFHSPTSAIGAKIRPI